MGFAAMIVAKSGPNPNAPRTGWVATHLAPCFGGRRNITHADRRLTDPDDAISDPFGARITALEEAVARIEFGVAAPQHVEVAARRHPTCWGLDARDWIRATASERAFGARRSVVGSSMEQW